MRKNIYNNKILMMEIREINGLASCIGRKLCDKEVISVLRKYLSIDGIKKLNDAEAYNREIGLSLDEEITLKIKESYEKYRENFPVSLKSINNAFLWAITTNADSEMSNILQFILINRIYFTIKELRETYGDDVLEYILLHGNYNIERGINPVIESDKKILLLHNEKVVETETQEMMNCTNGEIYSNAEDCRELAKYLKKKMGNKIGFDGVQDVWSGKYFHYHRESHSNLDFIFDDGLPFYYKFCKGAFLRIGVGNSYRHDTSVGEKLAALSNFYEVLREQYGEPTVFYTLKYDEVGTLTLQWSFIDKKEDIEEFRSGSYFDDAEIDELIVIGEEKKQVNDLQTQKNKMLGMLMGLPSELVDLADENLSDFVKYKTGKEINISENVMCDGVPAALYANDMPLKKAFPTPKENKDN